MICGHCGEKVEIQGGIWVSRYVAPDGFGGFASNCATGDYPPHEGAEMLFCNMNTPDLERWLKA